MKKLVLVTLLAVAASWLIHEARQSDREASPTITPMLRPDPGHGDPGRSLLVVQDDGLAPPRAIRPPSPPEPPIPPESIRPSPGRKGHGSRPKRAVPAPAIAASDPAASAKTPPSWFPESEADEAAKARPDAAGSRSLVGRVSVSETRALRDLRDVVGREVAAWLAADVPASWKVPAHAIGAMVRATYVQEVTRDLTNDKAHEVATRGGIPPGAELEALPPVVPPRDPDGLFTLYRAGQKLDFSSSRRAQILQMYRRDLASQRMQRLGGGLALALVGLAVLSGYIRADEATKGYYTNRLRLAAAAGLGVAGVAAYRFLV